MKYPSGIFTVYISVFISALALTGCGDIIQDLNINADGSGTLETTFDVGELMSMTKGFQGMGSDDNATTDDTIPDTSPPPSDSLKDPMQLLIDKVTDPSYDKNFDTIISFLDIMPDSIRAKETQPDLANQLSVRMVSPANSPSLTIGFVAKFKSPENLKELMLYMENLDEKPEMMASAGPVGLQTKSFLIFNADMKAGWIKIDSIKYGDVMSELGMSSDSTVSSEDLGMMEMMFGNSKIKSIIHVPGEVTSCTNAAAILTKDNRVLIEYDFLDVIRKGSIEGFTIHFTPGK